MDEEELTPESLEEWLGLMDAFERAAAEINRRSRAMEEGMRQHYLR